VFAPGRVFRSIDKTGMFFAAAATGKYLCAVLKTLPGANTSDATELDELVLGEQEFARFAFVGGGF
jgi:hypothetical protein